jgi:hypothetical protein
VINKLNESATDEDWKAAMKNLESSTHQATKTFLRVVGPLLVVAGLVLMATGMISFFRAFGGFEPPRLFWCCFVAVPVLFVGLVMSKFGYLGAVIRYLASESAPVAKDTINYLADGTKDAVKTVARSVAEGVQEAQCLHKEKP